MYKNSLGCGCERHAVECKKKKNSFVALVHKSLIARYYKTEDVSSVYTSGKSQLLVDQLHIHTFFFRD